MKPHYEIKQGTPQWHDIRYGKIGGTRSSGLFVKEMETLFFELLSEMTQDRDCVYDDVEAYQSDAMQRGSELEPEARNKAIAYTSHNFIECGWLQSEVTLLGISPDGITDDGKHALEIKCRDNKNHLKYIVGGQITKADVFQCCHYFTVNPSLETLTFMSYNPDNNLKPEWYFTLTRSSEVNIGTDAKPVIRTVQQVVSESLIYAETLEIRLTETINNLQF